MAPKGSDPRVVEPARRPGLTAWRLLLVLLIGGAAGLIFGSRALAVWADRLPDGYDRVRSVAAGWDAAMQSLSLTAPYDRLHGWVKTVAGPP